MTTSTSTTTTAPAVDACCREFAAMSRRSLLRGALALGGGSTMVGSAMVSASASSLVKATSVLVVLSLRGAADGLSLVVPHGDPVYGTGIRPNIAIPTGQLLEPNETFGLHPNLAPLVPMWKAGKVAAVHATGLPAPNRSHFSAMEELEDADPGSSKRVGWLNRLVGTRDHHTPLQGMGVLSGPPPTELVGPVPLMTVGSVDRMSVAADDEYDTDPPGKRRRSLETMWDDDKSAFGRAMRSTLAATADLAGVKSTADNTASYGDSDLGKALSAVARVIRADVGVEVLTVDQGDWDMHSGLGNLEWGQMIRNATDLSTAIAAFFNDLGTHADIVTLVALSEFGRRVVENDNWGLDHGYGNVMFVAGAGVTGGYYAKWPGLHDSLDADLAVTTDYRSVLSEVVSKRFGSSPSAVFPGFSPEAVGVMA